MPEHTSPRLAFVRADDVPWTEVIAQLHGERRASVHEKFLEWTPNRGSDSRRHSEVRALSLEHDDVADNEDAGP